MDNIIKFDRPDVGRYPDSDGPLDAAYGAVLSAFEGVANSDISLVYGPDYSEIRVQKAPSTSVVLMERLRGVFATEGIEGIQMESGACVQQGKKGPAVPEMLTISLAAPEAAQ